MRVFIPAATYLFRPNNTDWRYAAKMLPQIGNYYDDLDVVSQRSRIADWVTNASYAAHIADRYLKRVPMSWQYCLAQDCPVRRSEIEQAKADVVLSYERYPASSGGRPVIWITGPTLESNVSGRCATPEWLAREIEWKTRRAADASRIVFTSTEGKNKFFDHCGNEFRDKAVVVPFFLPGLAANDDLSGKWDTDELRILFVGREAHRKGLPQVLQALAPMMESRRNISLTIVSSFSDGPVDIPTGPNATITVHNESSHATVMELMAEAHILTMPSSRENYGFVYVEAMSKGCIPLAVDRPVQRELIGDGGILVGAPTAEAIAEGIAPAADMSWVRGKARKALQHFKRVHAPAAVAGRFRDLALQVTMPSAVRMHT